VEAPRACDVVICREGFGDADRTLSVDSVVDLDLLPRDGRGRADGAGDADRLGGSSRNGRIVCCDVIRVLGESGEYSASAWDESPVGIVPSLPCQLCALRMSGSPLTWDKIPRHSHPPTPDLARPGAAASSSSCFESKAEGPLLSSSPGCPFLPYLAGTTPHRPRRPTPL
jgi:hypothetical protein